MGDVEVEPCVFCLEAHSLRRNFTERARRFHFASAKYTGSRRLSGIATHREAIAPSVSEGERAFDPTAAAPEPRSSARLPREPLPCRAGLKKVENTPLRGGAEF